MKKLPLLFVLLTYALPAWGQDQPKDWADQWKNVSQRLLELAEAMPEEKYDYKPMPDMRTFGEQIKHVTIRTRLLLGISDCKTVSPKDPALDKLRSKKEIIDALRKHWTTAPRSMPGSQERAMTRACKHRSSARPSADFC